jgi:hypothetical protein
MVKGQAAAAAGGSCTEAEVRSIIGPTGAAGLIDVISDGWQDYVAEGKVRSRSTRAGIVWDGMIMHADSDMAPNFVGMHRVTVRGSAAYVLRDRILLRFKMHQSNLRTSNIPTAVQRMLLVQGYLDGMPELAHVTCGYVLDKAQAGIEKFVVVRHVRAKPEWHIDLKDLASGGLAPMQPIIPGTGGPDDLAPLPGIRRRDEAGEGSEQ